MSKLLFIFLITVSGDLIGYNRLGNNVQFHNFGKNSKIPSVIRWKFSNDSKPTISQLTFAVIVQNLKLSMAPEFVSNLGKKQKSTLFQYQKTTRRILKSY